MEEEEEEAALNVCINCGVLKPLTEFHKNKAHKNGKQSICKKCDSEKGRKYRLENKSRAAAANRKWRSEHRAQLLKSKRKYYRDHQEQIALAKRKYRRNHKEERSDCDREYRRNHKEERSDYNREYNQTEVGRINHKMCSHRRRARISAADGDSISAEQWQRILKKQRNTCNLCYKKFTKTRLATIDHIIPLAKGGDLTLSNTQALCQSCNCSKNAKILKCFINSWCL